MKASEFSNLAKELDAKTFSEGPKNFEIDSIGRVDKWNSNSIYWISEISYLINQDGRLSNSLIVCSKAVFASTSSVLKLSNHFIVCNNSNDKWLFAKLAGTLISDSQVSRIHSTAIIHEESIIGRNVKIGAYTVIGKAVIGDDTVIENHVIIENDVSIGSNCIISSNSVIGSSGSGFVKNPEGKWENFPQMGKLIIGDNVSIGVNTYICKGSLSDTIIGDYTKIGLSCCIGHNVKLGENGMVLANTTVAGSTIVGKNAYLSINVSVRNKLILGDNVFVGMGSVVTTDLPSESLVYGNPARPKKVK